MAEAVAACTPAATLESRRNIEAGEERNPAVPWVCRRNTAVADRSAEWHQWSWNRSKCRLVSAAFVVAQQHVLTCPQKDGKSLTSLAALLSDTCGR